MSLPDVQHERRIKRVRVGARHLITTIHQAVTHGHPDYVHVLDFPGLPPGCKVVGGPIASPGGMGWDVYLHHPSFPEVPDWEEPPFVGEEQGLFPSVRAIPLQYRVPSDVLAEALTQLLFWCGGSTAVHCQGVAERIAPKLANMLNFGLGNDVPEVQWEKEVRPVLAAGIFTTGLPRPGDPYPECTNESKDPPQIPAGQRTETNITLMNAEE